MKLHDIKKKSKKKTNFEDIFLWNLFEITILFVQSNNFIKSYTLNMAIRFDKIL